MQRDLLMYVSNKEGALMFLLQTKEISFWQKVVGDFFSENATFRYEMTNAQTEEKKVFGRFIISL